MTFRHTEGFDPDAAAARLSLTSTLLLSLPPPLNVSTPMYIGIGNGLSGWFLPGTLSYFFLFAAETILLGGLARTETALARA